MRESGWYWVRWRNADWEPLQWDAQRAPLGWHDEEFLYDDSDFSEIDERRIIRT